MKISAQEEYGIRCLLQLGKARGGSLTISEIARAEGLSREYVAKLMRLLRRAGLVQSARGQAGGYKLSRPLEEISVAEALAALGGKLWDPAFCRQHPGLRASCSHTPDCNVQRLWRRVQNAVDGVLDRVSLKDLVEPSAPDPAPPPRDIGLHILTR
ncbi:MAG: Rrf2 family transcriptional regulator [Bryobacterales bacterium]|nr:Rrf2 family transcriptional regulator [Bryobacteraceae bacterium]MDW8130442.1 Rrf2 family transcriptional regulator [Bryobacterales bacterium]